METEPNATHFGPRPVLPDDRTKKMKMLEEMLEEMCDIAEILHKNIKIPVSLGDAGALTKDKVKQLKEQLYG